MLELDEFERMPSSWTYYVSAKTAEEARAAVLRLFPHGATSHSVLEGFDASLDGDDVTRISIDVQRVQMPQEAKNGTAFHMVGDLRGIPTEYLAELAGYLTSTFPAAVIGRDGESVVFGVSVNAENHEEAQTDVEDALNDSDGLPACPMRISLAIVLLLKASWTPTSLQSKSGHITSVDCCVGPPLFSAAHGNRPNVAGPMLLSSRAAIRDRLVNLDAESVRDALKAVEVDAAVTVCLPALDLLLGDSDSLG